MHGSLNKRMKLLLGVPLLGLGLLGCLDAQGHATNLAAGSYQLSFALAAGNASVPVSGVNLTVSLPPGSAWPPPAAPGPSPARRW